MSKRTKRKRKQPARRPPAGPARTPSLPELQRRAVSAYQAGRLAESLAACREILRVRPDLFDALSFAARVAAEQGGLEEAEGLLERAVAARPEAAEAHFNLGCVRDERGAAEAAMDAYRRALALRPDFAPAHHNLGTVLMGLGRTRDATAAFRRAIELAPDAAESHRNLGICLRDAGDLVGAARAYGRAGALNPAWSPPFGELVTALIGRGDPADAVTVCDEWLRRASSRTEALAYKCAALNEAGDRAARDRLLDLDRFVKVIHLPPPPDYPSLDAFNAALARHVAEHPTLHRPPPEHPTYHHENLHITRELFAGPKGPMAYLEEWMYREVETWLDGLGDDPGHPFLADRPRRWRLTAWGTLIRDEGNLVPHIHLGGYMGGVYYPDLPSVVARSDADRAGWFELGRPPPEIGCRADAPARAYQPVEGMMLLFPAYFYHRTIPYAAPERRISIAFDLVPEG